jgi:hypothetical protein
MEPKVEGIASPLAPGKRAVRDGVQFTLSVPGKPERLEDRAFGSQDFFGNELADPDHLIPVVGIRNDIAVLVKDVEHREAVG